jgi:rhodanese-related sulfurtransferase/DNA-binding transcriptional ArsR family regulator
MRNLRTLARSHYGELARIGKALGSPVRLQLIDLLRQGPRSVELLAAEAGVSVANASQHLQQLSASRLVRAEKQGQRAVYRLSEESVSLLFGSIRELAEQVLPEMDRLQGELGVLDEEERAEVLEMIRARQATLIDVRPPEEYAAGHIAGALSFPLSDLKHRLGELPKQRVVIACCRGPYCPMAQEAVAILESAGFEARHLDLGAPDLSARRASRRKK